MEEQKDALFSRNKTYRYFLTRVWDDTLPNVAFIGLNPSTADHTNDDPTIRRCRNFAKSWGYGGMWMVNLFAFRSTDPKVMKTTRSDPIGLLNNTWLRVASDQCKITVACWGTHGTHLSRDKEVMDILGELHCIKQTKNGHPSHPLYLKSSLTPKLYQNTLP